MQLEGDRGEKIWLYFMGLLNGIAIGLIIAILMSSCHPYPYKSIKPDKTKHATFR